MRGLWKLGACLLAGCLSGQGAVAQVVGSLGEGVYRIDRSEAAREGALPSMSFEDASDREQWERVENRPASMPTFSDQGGRQVVTFDISDGTSLYGTGEVAGRLLRNGRTNVNWNSDSYGYDLETDSLYQSHPWVLAVRPDGTSFGVLADTTYRSMFDLREGIRIEAEGPAYPVIVIEGEHPREVVERLSDLTGRIEMPPKWALGYHQCRYSYNPDERVLEVARGFRERGIPCDVIWMDIDYMDGFRCFTFDPEQFPDPAGLNEELHSMGFHNVWMIDPGLKDEDGYFVHDQGNTIDAWVKTSDRETDYRGDVWPGTCVFPDYTSTPVRQWWAGLYREFLATGIDGVWNDMNEPAVFGVESKTMPEDNWHRADEAFGGPGPHARFHNVYGMLMVQATREGFLDFYPDRRPFVLSRANFIGGHRYAATWTGDNVASWKHMEWSVPMALNLGLSGQVFSGPDIGGFIGNGGATEKEQGELFARWMGVGALLPFSRGHTAKGNRDKEPWAFGPEVEATSRRALERRYVLMPYLYTLFWRAHTHGTPVMRPAFFADPRDPALRSEDDVFLLGDDLLVRTHMTPSRDRAVAMPGGIWRRFWFAERIEGGSEDPHLPDLYIRGGAIIPTGPVMQYVGHKPLDPLTLVVSLDENGRASGTLYEDAGDGWGHRRAENRVTSFVAERDADGRVEVSIAGYRSARGSELVAYAGEPGFEGAASGRVRVLLVTDDGMLASEGRFGEPVVIDPETAERVR